MNIYLVSRTDKVNYDEYDAFVVVADTPAQARGLLAEVHIGDNTSYFSWSHDNKYRTIGETNKYKKPTIILGSFNAG